MVEFVLEGQVEHSSGPDDALYFPAAHAEQNPTVLRAWPATQVQPSMELLPEEPAVEA
jgi:hypothetical protein